MEKTNIIYWQEGNHWLGYFQDYPDYWTQGEDYAELIENLKDLYKDMTNGEIPAIRKMEEIIIS